ncbi:MAG: KH domain-containing protein [Verrucomicrobia bacterium]|nr:KH domain-containing protein [Verrucomicrobiota bacterium]
MKEFIALVVRQLVDKPEEFQLRDASDARTLRFRVEVHPADVGKLIGRSGHTIQAIRSLLSAAASRHGKRAQVEIVARGAA